MSLKTAIDRWLLKRRHEEQLKICKRDGHILGKTGEITPAVLLGGAPVQNGQAEFWLYGCKCGYTEANEPNMTAYVRLWDEAEMFKKQGEYSVKATRKKEG